MKLIHALVICAIAITCLALLLLARNVSPTSLNAIADNALNFDDGRSIIDDCSLDEDFPVNIRRYCKIIEAYSTKNGLPPELIAAIIWLESGGEPKAYSKSGAAGLMQVMPRDGIAGSFVCLNGPCFSDRPSTEELFNPEYNISYGTELLASLIRDKGNFREGLRAYGPRDVGFSYADEVLRILEKHQ